MRKPIHIFKIVIEFKKIFSFFFLAATPDGKICENVECGLLDNSPYLARDMWISKGCVKINKFMLKFMVT